jgi:hypothetical protein
MNFDIGIVGVAKSENFGGSLAYYALYKVVTDLGYSALMIDRPLSSRVRPGDLDALYRFNPYPKDALADNMSDKARMRRYNDCCGSFLVGSDQVLQYDHYISTGAFTLLDWVRDGKRKVIYAASFGHDHFWGEANEVRKMAFFARRFDAVSVREGGGVELAKRHLGVSAAQTLDPVFLCDKKHYDEMIARTGILPKPGICAYILDPDRKKQQVLDQISTALDLPVEVFSEMFRSQTGTAHLWDLPLTNAKFDERLAKIAGCSFVVTDSFHGVCLALYFEKPFVAVLNETRGADRFYSLLNLLGLGSRMITDDEQLKQSGWLSEPIDYAPVREKLNALRKQSLDWLTAALALPAKPDDFTAWDMTCEAAQRQHFNQLGLSLRINAATAGYTLHRERRFLEYLEKLCQVKKRCVIIIALRGTALPELSEEFGVLYRKIGLSTLPKANKAYIGVADGGLRLHEHPQSDDESGGLNYATNIIGTPLKISVNDRVCILLDKKDYAVGDRGINITVYDKSGDCCVDSVNFEWNRRWICKRFYNETDGIL